MNSPNEEPNEAMLDRAIREIRSQAADPAVEEAAAARVWARLEQMPLEGCADFQALIPDYRAGKLAGSRAVLLEDHLHQCVACRRVMYPVHSLPERRPASHPGRYTRWAVAAALAIGVGLSAWGVVSYMSNVPSGSRARVETVEGTLLRVSEQRVGPALAGEEVSAGAALRTARDSDAFVRLEDGSLVEMSDRSEFRVTRSGKDLTVHLNRGRILVQAAKRRAGHLYVATRDCRVAVTGTVFSVNAGLKGSRVTVVEGAVLVAQAGQERILRPGQQYVSDTSVEQVPVRDEIAWSRNLDAHLALLQAASTLGQRLDAAHFPDLRYASTLLPLLPAETVVFASLPNLSKPLGEVQQVFHEKVQGNPALAEWWQQNGAKSDAEIAKLHTLSDYLGNEIVMAAVRKDNGSPGTPVFLAEVTRSGLEQFVAASGWPLRLAVSGKVAVFAADSATLQQVAAAVAGQGGFASTPFGTQVAAIYRDGIGLLLAADLSSIGKRVVGQPRALPLNSSPPQYVMVLQREVAGKPDTRAILSFAGARTGMASWLASPAPMAALDFLTPEAALVSAFVVKSPAAIVDELIAWHKAANPDFPQTLAKMESELGIQIRADLAAPLGAEYVLAQDGPALPTPAWKLAVEVDDPMRLQATIQKLVETANRNLTQHGKPAVQFSQETAGGRTYYTLALAQGGPLTEAHYVFTDGYLLMAPSRVLLDRAIQTRASGNTLARSAGFLALLPHDHYPNVSALLYQNVGASLAPLVQGLGAGTTLTPQQQQAVQSLGAQLKTSLVAAYGESDRITVAGTGSLFNLGLNNFGWLGLFQNSGTRRLGPAYRQ